MTQATEAKPGSIDARYASRVAVALPRKQWQAIRKACLKAQAKPLEARTAFVPQFLKKLDAVLKAPRDASCDYLWNFLDANAWAVDGVVANWANLAEVILTYGNEEAREGGAVIVAAASKAVFGAGKDAD